MKSRFNSYDIVCAITEIKSLVGFRVVQIYDVDHKTYLIKLQNNDQKNVLLIESGNRIHTTSFDWPKSTFPSGFSMKLRKHLKNKRLEAIEQVGADRIVDLQFGTGIASYHIIVEMYDRGNIILCDNTYKILNVLRQREEEDIRFAVREIYPITRAKFQDECIKIEELKSIIRNSHPGETLKSILNRNIHICGPALIDHFLMLHNIHQCKMPGEVKDEDTSTKKKKKNRNKGENVSNFRDFNFDSDFPYLVNVINDIYTMMQKAKETVSKGFIIQKKEIKPSLDNVENFYYSNIEFSPFLFNQYKSEPFKEFPTFMQAVDEFFSTLEHQKIDLKVIAQENEALKRLSNIKNDHKMRLSELTKSQQVGRHKAELIMANQIVVDSAIQAITSLLAKQNSWDDIETFLKERQEHNDKLALSITKLKFYSNQITLHLTDPYRDEDDDSSDDDEKKESDLPSSMEVDVDLSLTAFANATRYYEQKKSAAKKEQKTIEASSKALKSAERKTHQTLKDVKVQASITKSRKTYWFEKFYWFISSENYLVVGGRDQQQNELLVKRYLRPNDIYVHAEIQGASSIIIKNPSTGEIPPKTLLEAGTSSVCYSVAWDAKVVCSTYWVYAHQVSKTAPSGEYLPTGSFMIRGKKNFLPPSNLILGMGFMFKLEDGSVERHRGDRAVKTHAEENIEKQQVESNLEDKEVLLDDVSDDEDEVDQKMETITEEVSQVELKESESDEREDNYPDIQIKIEHDTGKIDIQHGSISIDDDNMEETLIHAIPMKAKRVERKMKPQKKKQQQQPVAVDQKFDAQKNNKNKRGQKGKLKKIKEKYKDQDDEDREMAMEILKSSGVTKPAPVNEENEEVEKVVRKKPTTSKQSEVNDLDDNVVVADETDMLEALTGCPVEEDELIFAIPVVAPYQSLQNYKFKVKLTPGTGKRGKAAKAAVQIFLRDKMTSAREKDLIKSVKEEFLARNIPGKVKVSAPQLLKIKK